MEEVNTEGPDTTWLVEPEKEIIRGTGSEGLLMFMVIIDPKTGSMGMVETFGDIAPLRDAVVRVLGRIDSGAHESDRQAIKL